MRVLVTGGTGFIGSHLAERVLRSGNQAVVLGLADLPEEKNNVHDEPSEDFSPYVKVKAKGHSLKINGQNIHLLMIKNPTRIEITQ